MKSSFTVYYLSPGNPEMCILGVTSIVPNLNGLLFFTEDGQNFQIESYEMQKGNDSLVRLVIEYSTEEDLKDAFSDNEIKVFDHRNTTEA